jgi:hypothetical protein
VFDQLPKGLVWSSESNPFEQLSVTSSSQKEQKYPGKKPVLEAMRP